MSLKHNQQKIKLIMGLFILAEAVLIVYFSITLYTAFNSNSNINFLFNQFEADFTKISGQNDKNNDVGGKDFYITASKNGIRFYYKNCSGLNRIKVENRVYFDTEEDAIRAGYTIANNCSK